MTPEIDPACAEIRRAHDSGSTDRVEEMLYGGGENRHPLQKDAKWILPGISSRPWHDPYEHREIEPVVRAFETAHSAVKAELTVAREKRRKEFADYEHYLMRQQNWQARYLFRSGQLVPESAEVVPVAMRVLTTEAVDTGKHCPLLEAHFSTLLPGAAIKPHCGIRVADEAREWKEGECPLFDYSFEHEAWNHGTRPRTCLLVDLWHPETTLPERAALTALVTEIRRLTA
ncbi:aspartyl/asparaginyl beta-hydroxylase domain-containing protein [Streptomyces fuscichromogenes]|uniref:Aspartyl/asparaginy/proline hydroxylase domain-containing protein n=1 Tax=Streptomyces fuscichromogenes TaxID=1324013 RepID=A0A918CX58_9ACTN|nr:aspartyl/asparaginyl beta-hydroxylase domain-containing protein [Streptomyces fuscichromogenes]GGN42468.1 hypothetical protein GCM10011578_091800 [Streptomyces fuscichromogenes]